MKLIVTLVTLILVEYGGAFNILAVLPFPILSHQMYFRPILRELANRGHAVTVVTMTPEEDANYKQIVVDKQEFVKAKGHVDFINMRNFYWYVFASTLSQLGEICGHATFQTPEVQELIHSTDLHFDLVLVESTFVQEANVVFGHKFGAPVVELHSLCMSFWANELMNNPYTLSYAVDFRTSSSSYMNFVERFYNTVLGISSILLFRYVFLPKQEALVDQYFNYTGWETRPPLINQLYNTSLAIVNTHVALHYSQPINPNVIYVPGVQIKPPTVLPQDIKAFLDTAEKGVIYFSLGSNLNSSMMPEATQLAFISAFAKLPHKVLWKWEKESVPNQSGNVKLTKWCPQTDVLAHPNIKAFISHGGILSITESVYHGVPLIVIPLFLDQFKNSKQAEAAGFGITLNFDNITEESIIWAVKEVTKLSYQESARKQSAVLSDNPSSSIDTAMYWIEYVIRHKGAPHLRTAGASLSWYQYFLVDVIAVFMTILIVGVFIVYIILRTMYRWFYGIKIIMKMDKLSKKNE